MTQYYDQHEERDYTEQELIAICNGEIKPYPSTWFDELEEIIEDRNQSFFSDYEDVCEAIANGDADIEEIDWTEFSAGIHQWQFLYCKI